MAGGRSIFLVKVNPHPSLNHFPHKLNPLAPAARTSASSTLGYTNQAYAIREHQPAFLIGRALEII